MSVAAHTNEVGEHTLYESRTETAYGWDGQRVDRTKTYDGIGVAISRKGGTSSGFASHGWRNPTNYSRSVSKLVTDTVTVVNQGFPPNISVDGVNYTRPQILSIPLGIPALGDQPGVGPNAVDMAHTKALNALREGRLQLGADLAEARKTADMIGGTTVQVLTAYKAARSGNWGSIPKILGMKPKDVLSGKSLTNRWLEYQYGWKPLMSSVYDLTKELGKGLRNGLPIYSAKGTGTDQGDKEFTLPHLYDTHHKCKVSKSVRAEVKYFYTVSSSVIDRIDSAGLLNPLSVAWELTPFSFVLDWFIPIGNTLSALSATAGLEFVSGYESVVTETQMTASIAKNDENAPRLSIISAGNYVTEHFDFRRTALTGFQPPRLYANPNPFSTAHILNALALIRQLL